MATDLVPSVNPGAVLENRERLTQAAQEVLLAVQRLNQLSRQAGFGATDALLQQMAGASDLGTPERAAWILDLYAKTLDVRGWDHLLHASGLRTFMDRQARAEWDKQIKDTNTPALTADNIEATFRSLHADRGSMVERGVIAVFRRLSWDYKANLPALFGKKIVVRHFQDRYGFLSHDAAGLEDLARAFALYDGQPEPDHRSGIYMLASRARKNCLIDTDYMHIRWFKNGNAHTTFKREDLVAKLNQVLSKHYPGALPAPR